MTVLKNTIHIEAPPELVWEALTKLDALHEYDPGIAKSVLRTDKRAGIGADRQCDINAYALRAENGGTRVDQTQEYTLKYGPLGAALDALVVRRKWDAGVKSFFAGLKEYVEAGRAS